MLVNQSPETRSAAVPAWLPEPLSRWQARAALRAARTPLLAFGAHLALALVVASLVMLLAPPRNSTTAAPPMDGLADIAIRPLANWDGVWYTGIAEHGYQYRQAQAAFWPLYPLLIRAGHTLTGLSYATVGVLVSNGAFLAALVLVHRLARLEWGRRVADRAVWLLALAPMAFFFSTAYTESLFLLLTVGAFYAARTDRWQWAGACGFLAALTRNVGGLLLLPLAIMLVQRYGWSPRRWWSRALPLAMVPVAPLFFFAHLDRIWGDPLLTIHAQRYWDRHAAAPWQTLAEAARLGLAYPRWVGHCLVAPGEGGLARCIAAVAGWPKPFDAPLAVLSLLLAIPLLVEVVRRTPPAYAAYTLAAVAVPLFGPARGDPLMSMPRFLVVLFPLAVVLAIWLDTPRRFRATLAVSTPLYVSLLAAFCMARFVA